MRPSFAEPSFPAWTTDLLAPTSISPGGGDGSGDGGEKLQEWSSRIGIITAIVGNVFIALALNVQRYAHTRLLKERIRVRQTARAALKRAQSSSQYGTYGTHGTIIEGAGNRYRNGHSNGNGNGAAMPYSGDCLGAERGSQASDPLMASFQPSATTASPDDEDETDDDVPNVTSSYLKSPYWWLGQILITLGEMGNFLAYGFAPASIVSPLGVVALISNCIIAPAMFHEKFRPRDFWGVVIAVSGAVTVVLSANQEETKLNPHDVWGAITTLEFEIYLGVTTLLIMLLMWASRKYGNRTILIDLGLVGLFGGYTALSTKGVSSMLSSTLWGAFTTPVTYALIFILLATAVMQIRYVNKALQRFDSTQVIPIQFVMFTLCVIIGSAVLYRDFEKTTTEQAVKFIAGCLLTFFGIFLITSGREHRDDEKDLLPEANGIEETIGLTQHDGSLSCPPQQEEVRLPRSRSRRSSRLSRVSFAEAVKPESAGEDGAVTPTLRYPESVTASGYLSEEVGSLVGNPWEASVLPPSAVRTISADSILTGSGFGSTSIQSDPATPMRDSPVPPTYPTDLPVTPRPGLAPSKSVGHRSRTFISPSPLSSTVTTVVKDAFLRGRDNSAAHRSSLRRIRSSLRTSLYFNDEGDEDGATKQVFIHGPDDNLLGALGHQETEPIGSSTTRGRSRSLSDTLGDFFRSKRLNKQPDSNVDGGSGP